MAPWALMEPTAEGERSGVAFGTPARALLCVGATGDEAMRSKLAPVFHKIMQLDARAVFHGYPDRLACNQPADAHVPAPGWVGKHYRAGSAVLVGINPGGGTKAYVEPRPEDRDLYTLLRRFRAAQDASAVRESFDDLCDGWITIQSTRHNIRRPISLILDALGLTVQDIAFLNLVPFRTADDKTPPVDVIRYCWAVAAGPQLAALKPGRVIFLGKKAADAFHRLDTSLGTARIDVYPRTNGDTYVAPDARLLLDRLMAEQMCAVASDAISR